MALKLWCGVVALSAEYRTCDREVVGSILSRAQGVKTLANFLTPYVPLFTKQYKYWYGLKALMPCGWGVKAGLVCVWVAGKTV